MFDDTLRLMTGVILKTSETKEALMRSPMADIGLTSQPAASLHSHPAESLPESQAHQSTLS